MTTVETRVRSVLDAPRGHRFRRTPAPVRETPQAREQRLLAQMTGNPRVAHRLQHGVLPLWMSVAAEHRKQAEQAARESGMAEPEPTPELAPTPAPEPTPQRTPGPTPVPRPRPEPDPLPPRGRHRAPRRRRGWATLTYGMALTAGALLGQFVGLLM